jgi:catechol 2,3-dioxygenase-like lactoylglutathione lyase family enzyme
MPANILAISSPARYHAHMKIKLTSVLVNDQEKACKFYTEILGFILSKDIPLGEYKWLTVVSPDGPADIELLLEPNENPAAQVFQKAIYDQGIPLTAFAVSNVQQEYERLQKLGVVFKSPPEAAGPTMAATFDDTCGNLIQIYQD